MGQKMLSGFWFVCHFCRRGFERPFEHDAEVLPFVAIVECPHCHQQNVNPGTPEPSWTRPATSGA